MNLSAFFDDGDLDAVFRAADTLPAGEYLAELASGTLTASKGGKPRYTVRLRIAEGEHAGRTIIEDIYLTPNAASRAKWMLAAIGITSAERLKRPLPAGLYVRARISIEEYAGNRRNRVASWSAVKRPADEPAAGPANLPPSPPDRGGCEPDPFAPDGDDLATEGG